jgi:hypothetical protein
MSDTAPSRGQRDGEVDCTAPLATAELGRPSRAGTTAVVLDSALGRALNRV